jgi:hypothetical protein
VQAGIDAGLRLGVTSAKQAEIKGLRAEIAASDMMSTLGIARQDATAEPDRETR